MTELIATLFAVALVESARVLAGGYIIGKVLQGLMNE